MALSKNPEGGRRRLAHFPFFLATPLQLFGDEGRVAESISIAGQGDDGTGIVDRLRERPAAIRGEALEVSLLLRAIGRQAGVNIIVDEAIEETISLDLEGVTLYDVFQMIMDAKDLRYYESNKALLVKRAEDFKKDQRDVRMVRLCATFGDVGNHLDELEILKSGDGSLTVSHDGNCLIVRDHEGNIAQIKELLRQLDQPLPQVHIKARIVTIDKSKGKQLGIKWNYNELTRVPSDSLSAETPDVNFIDPATEIIFGFIRDNWTLDVNLAAMQEKKHLHILSSPRIVVLDGQEAEIKQGKEVPYESGTRENRNTSFREAVLSLTVIPKILQNNYIRLDLKVTNDSVDEDNTNEDGQPLLNRQEIRTNLFLEDGITVVVGGILAKGTDFNYQEVPWLAEIPWIGELFRNRDELEREYELLIFLTPTIIKEEHAFLSHATFEKKASAIAERKLVSLPGEKGEMRQDFSSGPVDPAEQPEKSKLSIQPLETLQVMEFR